MLDEDRVTSITIVVECNGKQEILQPMHDVTKREAKPPAPQIVGPTTVPLQAPRQDAGNAPSMVHKYEKVPSFRARNAAGNLSNS